MSNNMPSSDQAKYAGGKESSLPGQKEPITVPAFVAKGCIEQERGFIRGLMHLWVTTMRMILVRVTNVITLSVRETGIVENYGVAAPVTQLAWSQQQQGVRKLWNMVCNPLYRLRRRHNKYIVPGWKKSSKELETIQPLSDPTATLAAAQNWAGEPLSKEIVSEAEWYSSMHIFAHTALCDTIFDCVEEVHAVSERDNVTGNSQVAEYLLPHPATHGYAEGGVRSDDGDNRDLFTMVGHWIMQLPLFWLIISGASKVRMIGRFNSDLSNVVGHDWDSEDRSGDEVKPNERPIPWTSVQLSDCNLRKQAFTNLRTSFPNPRVFGEASGFFDGCTRVTDYVRALLTSLFDDKAYRVSKLKSALRLVFTRIASDAPGDLHGSRPHRGRPGRGPKVFIETRGEFRLQVNSFVGTKQRDTRRANVSALLPVERRSSFACASWEPGWLLDTDAELEIPTGLVQKYRSGSEMWVVPQHVFAQLGMVEEAIRAGVIALCELVGSVNLRFNTRHHKSSFWYDNNRAELGKCDDWLNVLRCSHPLWEPLRMTRPNSFFYLGGEGARFEYGNKSTWVTIPHSNYLPLSYLMESSKKERADHKRTDEWIWMNKLIENLTEALEVPIPVYIHRPLKFYDNQVTEKVTDYTGEVAKVNPPMMDYDDTELNADLLLPCKSVSLSGRLIDELSEVL
jgi:hypothetical protein